MADSIKTLLMSGLPSNDTPSDTDTMIVANGNTLKKTTIAKLVDFWKSKLGINDINTKLGNVCKIRSQTVDNIEVPANGTTDITFNQLTAISGFSRIPVNCNFSNASSSGGYYSLINEYGYTISSGGGITVSVRNYTSSKARIKATLTILYASGTV